MSHRHQSRRRRSYGRRQHELGERRGRRGEGRVREWLGDESEVSSSGFLPAQDDGAHDAGPAVIDR